jgi:hypothetical protein
MLLTKINKDVAKKVRISTAELEHAILVSKGLKAIGDFSADSE